MPFRPVPRCRSSTAIFARSRSAVGQGEAACRRELFDEGGGDDLAGHEADDARAASPPRHAEVVVRDGVEVDRPPNPFGHLHVGDLADRPAREQHEVGHERLEVGQDQDIRAVAGGDRAEVVEPVVERRAERGHDKRVLGWDPECNGVPDDRVDVPVVRDLLRLAVVGAEGDARRPVLERERRERAQVARCGGLADEQPEPGPQPLASLLHGRGLVVGADPRRGVGVQLRPENAGRMTVDVASERQLCELGRRARDDAGEVHHLGEPQHPVPVEQPLEVADRQLAPRRLERRRRNARRRHEVGVERDPVARVDEPVHAVATQHVRDLVGVRDDGRRPERQHEPRELVDEELRRLEMDVRVDEAGDDVAPLGVERLDGLVGPDACDDAVHDRDVPVRQPLAREGGENPTPVDHEVGRLVAAGDGEPSRQRGHRAGGMARGRHSTTRGRGACRSRRRAPARRCQGR